MTPNPRSDTSASDGPLEAWEGRKFYWGDPRAIANLHDAIAAAVNAAGLDDGTPFIVVYSEVRRP